MLCRILAAWQRRVLRAAMKQAYACHRDTLRRAVSAAYKMQWAQLGPSRLRAVLAVWRLRARIIGLAIWRWGCYRQALLRAVVDAWHFAILHQRSHRVVAPQGYEARQFAAPLGPAKRGPAIRHASRTRVRQPRTSTENPAAARRAMSAQARTRDAAALGREIPSPRRRSASASAMYRGCAEQKMPKEGDLGATPAKLTPATHLRRLAAAGFESEDLRLRGVSSSSRLSAKSSLEHRQDGRGEAPRRSTSVPPPPVHVIELRPWNARGPHLPA